MLPSTPFPAELHLVIVAAFAAVALRSFLCLLKNLLALKNGKQKKYKQGNNKLSKVKEPKRNW